jgi:hypothetical protein
MLTVTGYPPGTDWNALCGMHPRYYQHREEAQAIAQDLQRKTEVLESPLHDTLQYEVISITRHELLPGLDGRLLWRTMQHEALGGRNHGTRPFFHKRLWKI